MPSQKSEKQDDQELLGEQSYESVGTTAHPQVTPRSEFLNCRALSHLDTPTIHLNQFPVTPSPSKNSLDTLQNMNLDFRLWNHWPIINLELANKMHLILCHRVSTPSSRAPSKHWPERLMTIQPRPKFLFNPVNTSVYSWFGDGKTPMGLSFESRKTSCLLTSFPKGPRHPLRALG